MLNLSSLLAFGESEKALLAVIQDWNDRCNPATPHQQELVDSGIAAEWRFQRMDRLYHAMRDPNNIETDTRQLAGLLRQRHHLARRVQMYKKSTGYYKPGTEPKKTPAHILAALAEKRKLWRRLQ